jgi:hypothetical protein
MKSDIPGTGPMYHGTIKLSKYQWPGKVTSRYRYPEGYKVKDIGEQVAILRQRFPELDAAIDERIATQPLPQNAEGWFAIPRWKSIGARYSDAIQKMLAAIASTRPFTNGRKNFLGPTELVPLPKTVRAFRRIGEMQSGRDILIIPCQFGLRHRGCSSVFVRDRAMEDIEFGLGTFAVGCMLLTHPEREVRWEHLHVFCVGDAHGVDPMGGNSLVTVFFFNEKEGPVGLALTCDTNTHAYKYVGAASGFLLV